MKALPVLALVLLASCLPHYYAIKPYYGTLEFDRPVSNADTVGVMVEFGWYPQQRAHEKRMETLAIAGLTNNGGLTEEEIEALFAKQDDADEPKEEHVPFMPPIPEDEEDRWNILAYGAVALMMAVAAWIFSKRKKNGS